MRSCNALAISSCSGRLARFNQLSRPFALRKEGLFSSLVRRQNLHLQIPRETSGRVNSDLHRWLPTGLRVRVRVITGEDFDGRY